jgi:hypothetical protein
MKRLPLGIQTFRKIVAKKLLYVDKTKMCSESKIKGKIKEWYNGYSWNGIDRIYNPTSLL